LSTLASEKMRIKEKIKQFYSKKIIKY